MGCVEEGAEKTEEDDEEGGRVVVEVETEKGGTGEEEEGGIASVEVMRLRATWICSRGSEREEGRQRAETNPCSHHYHQQHHNNQIAYTPMHKQQQYKQN